MTKQIHMKHIFYIISILLFAILASCHNEEPSKGLVWDKESEAIVRDGITVNSERQTLILNFTKLNESSLLVHTGEEWLAASLNEWKGQLTIQVKPNESYEERTGNIIMTIGNQVIKIQIHQR